MIHSRSRRLSLGARAMSVVLVELVGNRSTAHWSERSTADNLGCRPRSPSGQLPRARNTVA